MKNYIEHTEFVNLYNKNSKIFEILFKDCILFSTVINRMKKLSLNYKDYSYSDEEGAEKMVGDLFEIFAEIFFKVFRADNRVGVYDYKPEQVDDCGVDGSGKGIDNKPLTVQVKFRGDSSVELVERDLKEFGYQSIVRFNVDKDTKNNMVIFTSAKGLNWFTDSKVYLNRFRTISYEAIRGLVDNNHSFWNEAREYVAESVKVYYE